MEKDIFIDTKDIINGSQLRRLKVVQDKLDRVLTYDEFIALIEVYNNVVGRLTDLATKQGINIEEE